MNEAENKTRRRYSTELSQKVLEQCADPGSSVASIALSYSTIAKVVKEWRHETGGTLPSPQAPEFVSVPLPPGACAPVPDSCIKVRSGATNVAVTWPLEAADQCAV